MTDTVQKSTSRAKKNTRKLEYHPPSTKPHSTPQFLTAKAANISRVSPSPCAARAASTCPLYRSSWPMHRPASCPTNTSTDRADSRSRSAAPTHATASRRAVSSSGEARRAAGQKSRNRNRSSKYARTSCGTSPGLDAACFFCWCHVGVCRVVGVCIRDIV